MNNFPKDISLGQECGWMPQKEHCCGVKGKGVHLVSLDSLPTSFSFFACSLMGSQVAEAGVKLAVELRLALKSLGASSHPPTLRAGIAAMHHHTRWGGDSTSEGRTPQDLITPKRLHL